MTAPTLGAYSMHIAREGFGSIVHTASGEIMHARTPPMEEARLLYVEQAQLSAHLSVRSDAPLIVWDVGLGAAANALAALECFEAAHARPLHLVSFENDLDPLRLALAHIDKFPYLDRDGPRTLLADGAWEFADCRWELRAGDFEDMLTTAPGPPDVIFYDMFSSRTIPGPWKLETFQKLRALCGGHATELFTYTVSTAARATLLAAGFFLARGRNAGHKQETTIALTPAAAAASSRDFLGSEWIGKWHRSTARWPAEIAPHRRADFEALILAHPQFRAA